MSSILKALRKLEEEKSRREEGPIVIARDILRGSQGRRPRSGGILLLVGVLFLVGAGLVAAVLLWPGRDQERVAAVVPAAGTSTAPSPQSEATPTLPPPSPEAVPMPAVPVATAQPLAPAVIRPGGVVPGIQASFTEKSLHAVPLKGSGTDPAVVEGVGPAPDRPDPAAKEGFSLSGIAFQDDPSARLAIINDLPVMQGTVIEGARVDAILKDRVILSRGEERFELRMVPEDPK
jgi:general secretion pathway protein B